jgi:hypothetical protein
MNIMVSQECRLNSSTYALGVNETLIMYYSTIHMETNKHNVRARLTGSETAQSLRPL